MAGNRVEELEAKVRELEATIDGLTDEMLATKERLQVVEAEVGVDPDIVEGRVSRKQAQEILDGEPADDPAAASSIGESVGEFKSEETIEGDNTG